VHFPEIDMAFCRFADYSEEFPVVMVARFSRHFLFGGRALATATRATDSTLNPFI
jgi:hypothetical protein